MNLEESLILVDQLCEVSPADLESQMHKACQSVLGQMSSRKNFQIIPIKDELNRLINEKAKQLVIQYYRILSEAEINDYKVLPQKLSQHARVHLKAHYSEACHQLERNKGLMRNLAPDASGMHLQADYEKMLQWVDLEIRILVAKLEKAETSCSAPTVASAVSKDGGLIPPRPDSSHSLSASWMGRWVKCQLLVDIPLGGKRRGSTKCDRSGLASKAACRDDCPTRAFYS